MTRARRTRLLVGAVALAALVPMTGAGNAQEVPGGARGDGSTAAVADRRGDPAVVERLALRAGLQVGRKHTTRPVVRIGGRRYAAPDPALAQLLTGTRVDTSYWRHHRRVEGLRRMRAQTSAARMRSVPVPFPYVEREPMGTIGDDDDPASSERLRGLGIGQRYQAARVRGRLSSPPVASRRLLTREDQGSIRQATRTGLDRRHPRVAVYSRVGDGPHGAGGDRHGDFDFYHVRGVARSTIAVSTVGSRFDTVLAVYDAQGRIVASNDDANGDTVTSAVQYTVPRTGHFYVMVSGFGEHGSLPADPFRSGSGTGLGAAGRYRLQISARPVDRDFYGVRLHSGDVLGGVLTGRADKVQVHRVDGHGMVGSQQDVSSAYPSGSPLPGGGATFAYVAEEPGWYSVEVQSGAGSYQLLLETYLAGTADTPVQTIFLDFDGARVNTAAFGGPGVSTLSPMRRFLGRWGLSARAQDAVVNATVSSVKENLAWTPSAIGLNPALRIRVLNSRDHPDPFGQPDVSRVIVGGTVAQSGLPVIGIAQSIDPGNYAHEESAIVLLDELSAPAGAADSLNSYLGRRSSRASFVGHALGNLIAHETGHMVGSFHTHNRDARVNLMDMGGGNYRRFFGTGLDGLGGTADDTDVDFGEDVLAPEEGFTGLEDTLNNSAWAFMSR